MKAIIIKLHIAIAYTLTNNSVRPQYFEVLNTLILSVHRKLFSKSYQIKLKSYCIYHVPIDLEHTNRMHRIFANDAI